MRCPKCTNEIPNDSKICPICQNIFATYFEEVKLTKKQKLKLFAHRILFPTIISLTTLTLIICIITKNKTKMNRITDVENLTRNNETYINDLYISDGRHYKYLLTSEEKEIYDIIINEIQNFSPSITINLEKYNINESDFITKNLKNIKNILAMDHPELINLKSLIYTVNDKAIHIRYEIEENQDYIIGQIKTKIEQIQEETNSLSEYEKIKYVYNYLSEENIANESSSAACIITKNCNDQGYAKISQIIFQNLKINSLLATGSIDNKYHEWNIVKIENKYYNFDVSASKKNNQLSYDGLLFKNKNYKLYYKNLMPNINGKKYLNKETK